MLWLVKSTFYPVLSLHHSSRIKYFLRIFSSGYGRLMEALAGRVLLPMSAARITPHKACTTPFTEVRSVTRMHGAFVSFFVAVTREPGVAPGTFEWSRDCGFAIGFARFPTSAQRRIKPTAMMGRLGL